jgi:hypothetical protein
MLPLYHKHPRLAAFFCKETHFSQEPPVLPLPGKKGTGTTRVGMCRIQSPDK